MTNTSWCKPIEFSPFCKHLRYNYKHFIENNNSEIPTTPENILIPEPPSTPNIRKIQENIIDLTQSDSDDIIEEENEEEKEELLIRSCFSEDELESLFEEWYENHNYEDQYDPTIIEWCDKYDTFAKYLKSILQNRLKCKNLDALLKNRNSLVNKLLKGKEPDNGSTL
ncbi:hypothetical protein H8356DRAFT_1431762 [Neocallimastix lanati (nom. inval.)]|nr:hypothetical protein H8356DRAFT_1431762 [Neocallimastix sp. JGI-2020a]